MNKIYKGFKIDIVSRDNLYFAVNSDCEIISGTYSKSPNEAFVRFINIVDGLVDRETAPIQPGDLFMPKGATKPLMYMRSERFGAETFLSDWSDKETLMLVPEKPDRRDSYELSFFEYMGLTETLPGSVLNNKIFDGTSIVEFTCFEEGFKEPTFKYSREVNMWLQGD